jgi:hypothetical protein
MNDSFLAMLKRELVSLDKSAKTLALSLEACQKIGIKPEYLESELKEFEALTARFARLSDLLIQKIFRLIDTLELLGELTIIDRINRAEKRRLIPSSKLFAEIRMTRNIIAHEYEPDEYIRLFAKILEFSPLLLEAVSRTRLYCQDHFFKQI